jgi:hypothetical protein
VNNGLYASINSPDRIKMMKSFRNRAKKQFEPMWIKQIPSKLIINKKIQPNNSESNGNEENNVTKSIDISLSSKQSLVY